MLSIDLIIGRFHSKTRKIIQNLLKERCYQGSINRSVRVGAPMKNESRCSHELTPSDAWIRGCESLVVTHIATASIYLDLNSDNLIKILFYIIFSWTGQGF